MLGYTDSRSLYGSLTDNQDSSNLTLGDTLLNEGIRQMLGDIPWPFLQTTTSASTVAAQQTYTLPGNLARLIDVYILIGTVRYTPTEVTSFDDFNRIQASNNIQSDNVTYYFQLGNTVQFWPTPASNGNTIVYEYLLAVKDMSVANFTTGTIVTATNGSATLTGSATSWTAGMAGKKIRITAGNAANLGDGLWYTIKSVDSSTSITLSAVYTGASITAGSATYAIVDASVIPEKYQIGPVYYAAAEYWRKNGDENKASHFSQMFDATLQRMKREESTKGTSTVVDDNTDLSVINPNLNRSAT